MRPAEAPAETVDSLGALILSLLPTLPTLHSVSLHDAGGVVQWISEGVLGPDELGAAATAITTLTGAANRAHCEVAISPTRSGLFLALRASRLRLMGVVMLVMEARSKTSGNPAARILNTSMRSALQRVAVFLEPRPAEAATSPATVEHQTRRGELLEVSPEGESEAEDTASESAINDLLDWQMATQEPSPLEPVKTTGATTSGIAVPALAPPEGQSEVPMLRLRELVRLRAGGRTRHYQIVPLVSGQRGDALGTLAQLLKWINQNPKVLKGDPLNFSIGISAQFLADPALPETLARILAESALDPKTLGIEIREVACITHKAHAERLLAKCAQIGCFAVIDDFTFNTVMLDLLRSSAVRMLKVETRLVATAMRDKLSHARVIAIAQAAKVLGLHCTAKYVDSQSGRRWLAAVGYDFSQASADEALESLIGR